jgi:hypothetical protein
MDSLIMTPIDIIRFAAPSEATYCSIFRSHSHSRELSQDIGFEYELLSVSFI